MAFDLPNRTWHDAQIDVTTAGESLRALASGINLASLACSAGASPWQPKQSIDRAEYACDCGSTAVAWQPAHFSANVSVSQCGFSVESSFARLPRPNTATTDSSSAWP